jgi:hypothetical protein
MLDLLLELTVEVEFLGTVIWLFLALVPVPPLEGGEVTLAVTADVVEANCFDNMAICIQLCVGVGLKKY